MSDRKYHIETLAVHAGQDAHGDPATNARAVPVYRTTAYNFRDSKYGADLCRLWAASADYTLDMRCSDAIFKQLSDKYLKIRNTARYILGNLNGFDPNAPERFTRDWFAWANSMFGELIYRLYEDGRLAQVLSKLSK